MTILADVRTFALYSSGGGSTYVSSRFRYRSKSVRRLMKKVCFASNGCPFMARSAREASSAFLNSMKMQLQAQPHSMNTDTRFAVRPEQNHAPFALPIRVVPRYDDVIRLYGASLAGEVLGDLLQQFVELRFVDNGDAVDDEDVVETFIVLDLISTREQV